MGDTAKDALLKFIYSEKAKKCYEISTVDLTVTLEISQNFGGLLRIYELLMVFK